MQVNAIRIDWPFGDDFARILRSNLDRFTSGVTPCIDIDCSCLENVTSSDITQLWKANLACEEYQVKLRLFSANKKLLRILRVLDLHDMFTVINEESDFDAPVRYLSHIDGQETILNFSIEPTSAGVKASMMRLKMFMAPQGVPEVVNFEMQTLIYEVITNIRLHGYPPVNSKVDITCSIADSKLIITICDSCTKFNPIRKNTKLHMDVALAIGRTRGFGLVLINRLANELIYNRIDDTQNHLTIVKEWCRND